MLKCRTAYLAIFALALTALVFRPFLTYQLAISRHLTGNPAAMNTLLQRLIKKKDDHHVKTDEEQAFIRQADKKLPRLPGVTRAEKPGMFHVHHFLMTLRPDTRPKFGLVLHYYALYGRFRI